MFKLSDEDEDSFFTPVTNSNLASLFGTTVVTTDANACLTYSAPKEPLKIKPSLQNVDTKDRRASPIQKPQSSVVVMKIVHAFKLVENKYVPLGKLGFALVGVSEHYQLILYQGKNDYKMTTKVRPSFQLSIHDNNYVSFYDDLKQNWSLMFSDEKDLNEFSHEVEICGGKLIYIKRSAEMSKPSLPEKPERLHHESEKTSGAESPTLESDSSVRSKTKESILSRMAKMGQPILLPSFTSSNQKSDVTDSDTEEERKSNKKQTKRIPEANAHAQLRRFDRTTESIVLPNVMSPVVDPYETYRRAMQMVPIVTSNPMSPEALNVYFAENRTHNSEVRMCMMKLDTKIDKVLEKLDRSADTILNQALESNIVSTSDSQKINELELKLEDYKQRVIGFEHSEKKLNESKQIIDDYELRIAELEHKLNDSLDRLKSSSDKIEQYETRINELQVELKSLREYKETSEKINKDFELERNEYETRILDLKDRMKTIEVKSSEIESRNAELSAEIESSHSKPEQADDRNHTDAVNKNLEADVKQAMNDLYVQLSAGDKDLRSVIVNSTYKLIARVTASADVKSISEETEKKTTN